MANFDYNPYAVSNDPHCLTSILSQMLFASCFTSAAITSSSFVSGQACDSGVEKRAATSVGAGHRVGGLGDESLPVSALMDNPTTVQVFFSVGQRQEVALFSSSTPADQVKGKMECKGEF